MVKYFFLSIQMCTFIITSPLLALSFWDLDPHEVRDLINKKIVGIEAERPYVFSVHDVKIEHEGRVTPLRIYVPNKCSQLPIVIFIHGGAWVAGNLDTHDNMARYIAKEAEALVVAVDYLNSPEGKFPIPLEQCYDALLWIIDHAEDFYADTKRLAVIGDSAGGNMAAALCLLSRDRKGPIIDLQILINPSTDLTGKGTIQRQGDALDSIRWYATQYVEDPNDVNNPYVSPITAKDLTHLPTALVVLAEKDELRNDGQQYADRLILAGVPTNVYTQWGIGHLAGNGARASIQARESLNVAVAALRGVFLKKKPELRDKLDND